MQVKTWLSLSSLACAVLMVSAPAIADTAALQKQIQSQQNQIYMLQQDIATLRGEMEQLRYLVARGSGTAASSTGGTVVNIPMGNTSGSSSSAASSGSPAGVKGTGGAGPVTPMGNDNLAAHNQGPAPSAKPAAGGGVALKGVDAEAKIAYEGAYAKVQQNDLKGAQSAFKSYVEKYPDNALTPNAWYWLGQVQYSQAQYDQARLSFLNVARYNDSQKRPDALYKLGMISKFLGDTDKALRYFQLVLQNYPNDAAATLASRELQRLQ